MWGRLQQKLAAVEVEVEVEDHEVIINHPEINK
jgi:hypothetical protein